MTNIADSAILPPTEPITLPMRDEFGEYFNEWVHEAQARNDAILKA